VFRADEVLARQGTRRERWGPDEAPPTGGNPARTPKPATRWPLRHQGERGFALMSQRWRTLQRVMLSLGKIGDITKAALDLVQFEHKMISLCQMM
jgi:hypothetical protein